MEIDPRLIEIAKDQPYPLLFATISGAHLYGFPSADSDYDLRGVHILPPEEVLGLNRLRETIELSHHPAAAGDIDLDLVTHDVKKFMLLMLKKNGYVLEQLYSPLVVHTTPEHDELKEIGTGCITRHHTHHYLGFSRTHWELFTRDDPPRVKPLLYVYRGLLTGIHLMQTGEVEANLVRLNEKFRLHYIDDLTFHQREYERLTAELEQAKDSSALPERALVKEPLNDLLLRVRGLALS